MISFKHFLIGWNASFDEVIIEKFPLSFVAADRFALDVSVPIFFSEKEHETWTDREDDFLYLNRCKRFLFESFAE